MVRNICEYLNKNEEFNEKPIECSVIVGGARVDAIWNEIFQKQFKIKSFRQSNLI